MRPGKEKFAFSGDEFRMVTFRDVDPALPWVTIDVDGRINKIWRRLSKVLDGFFMMDIRQTRVSIETEDGWVTGLRLFDSESCGRFNLELSVSYKSGA